MQIAGRLTDTGADDVLPEKGDGRLLANALGLAFVSAVLLWALASTQLAALGTPVPVGETEATTRGLRMAVEGVLAALAVAEEAAVTGAGGASAEQGLKDAWETLAVVHARMEAQVEVAEGKRPPLMGAAPPAPPRAARDSALVGAAVTYARAALEESDQRALERARDLLGLGG